MLAWPDILELNVEDASSEPAGYGGAAQGRLRWQERLHPLPAAVIVDSAISPGDLIGLERGSLVTPTDQFHNDNNTYRLPYIQHGNLDTALGFLLKFCHITTCKISTTAFISKGRRLSHALFYCFLRRESIVLTSNLAALSISSSVDHLPSVRRNAPSASSRDLFIAISTGEGSVLPSWHAEPVELAISGMRDKTSSPITPRTLTFRVLGK